jgi:hypothetical protein
VIGTAIVWAVPFAGAAAIGRALWEIRLFGLRALLA